MSEREKERKNNTFLNFQNNITLINNIKVFHIYNQEVKRVRGREERGENEGERRERGRERVSVREKKKSQE